MRVVNGVSNVGYERFKSRAALLRKEWMGTSWARWLTIPAICEHLLMVTDVATAAGKHHWKRKRRRKRTRSLEMARR